MAPPLHEAVMKGDAARVRALLEAGDAPDTANDVRNTPQRRVTVNNKTRVGARAATHAALPARAGWICAALRVRRAGRCAARVRAGMGPQHTADTRRPPATPA
jgi:hypothetical protein